SGPGHPLEVDGRDDLVGVDIAASQRNTDSGVCGEFLHGKLLGSLCGGRGCGVKVSSAQTCFGTRGSNGASGLPSKEVRSVFSGRSRSATAESVPRTAVAAATSGETRWVRPPLPCRPSK